MQGNASQHALQKMQQTTRVAKPNAVAVKSELGLIADSCKTLDQQQLKIRKFFRRPG